MHKVQNNGCVTCSELEGTVNGDFEHLDTRVVKHMFESEPKRKQQWLASGGDKIDYRRYVVHILCNVTTHQTSKNRLALEPLSAGLVYRTPVYLSCVNDCILLSFRLL